MRWCRRHARVARRGPVGGRVAGQRRCRPELHGLPDFVALAQKYGLTYGRPDWVDDIIDRYRLNQPTH